MGESHQNGGCAIAIARLAGVAGGAAAPCVRFPHRVVSLPASQQANARRGLSPVMMIIGMWIFERFSNGFSNKNHQ